MKESDLPDDFLKLPKSLEERERYYRHFYGLPGELERIDLVSTIPLPDLVERACEQVKRTGQALRLEFATAEEQSRAAGLVGETGCNVRQGVSGNPERWYALEIWPERWKPHALPCPPGVEVWYPKERLP